MSIILAAAAIAAAASGEFKASKHPPIRPKYAIAYETRDMRDARKRVVELLLTDVPLDVAAAVAELDPHMEAVNQDALRDRNYIVVVVRPDGSASMNATYSERMLQFVDTTGMSLKAELTTNTPDRVEGRLFSPKKVETSDESWTVDVHFAADVTRAPAGTKLAAGGGAPGKALQALMTAVAKKNWAGIKAAVPPDKYDGVDEAVSMLENWLPKKNAKITGGELRGDTAILDVEGEVFEGMKGLMRVRMKKSGEQWLFDRSVRAGFLN